jgi:hypothetical protein
VPTEPRVWSSRFRRPKPPPLSLEAQWSGR